MPEQACDRRNVHALLDGARRKRMANVVKPNVRQVQAVQHISPVGAQMVRVEHAAHCAVNDEILSIRRPAKQRAKPLPLHSQQALQHFRQVERTFRSLGFRRAEHQFCAFSVFRARVDRDAPNRLRNMQRAARRVVTLPPHRADLAEPHSGVERKNNARVVERQVGKQPLFKRCLRVIAQHRQLFRAAVRVNRCRNRVDRHNAVCDRTFAADIEHHSHIFHTFRAQRSAGAQISMQRFPV